MSGLKERVAIVTGGTGALGRVVVKTLADEGFKVYVPVLTMDEFSEVFDESSKDTEDIRIRKIFAFDCDATSEESVNEFVEKVNVFEKGNIGYLVNTIGGIDEALNVELLPAASVRRMLDLNLFTALNFTKAVTNVMKKNQFGRIVSIGALAALQTSPGRFAYSVSKQAVVNLMNTVSAEMNDFNIRCNTIVPGIIDTPANREWGSGDDIRSWVKPEEVASVVSMLFSERGGAVKESIIKVLGAF